MGLLRILGLERPTAPRTMSDHIITTKAAVLRDSHRMDELAALYNPHTGHCCPSCASAEYRELCSKQERRRVMLSAMLRRRGHPGDAEHADLNDRGHWP